MIRVDIAGVEEVFRQITRKADPRLNDRIVGAIATEVHLRADAGADRHTKTGALVASLVNRAIPGGREIAHDLAAAPYAPFVHFGTRPHEIRPKDRKVLRWANGGAFIFAKVVHHPGYGGDPYLFNAAEEVRGRLSQIVSRVLKNA